MMWERRRASGRHQHEENPVSEYHPPGTLNVRDLRRLLAEAVERGLPEDAPVVLARDSEGNAYSLLAGWSDEEAFIALDSVSGELASWDDAEEPYETHADWFAALRADHPTARQVFTLWPEL